MRRWWPRITIGAVALALAWAFVYLKALHPFGSLALNLGKDNLPGIGLRFSNVVLAGRQDGHKVWSISARSVDVSRDRRLVTFRGIRDGLLLNNDTPIVAISADAVVYNAITRNLSVPGTARMRVKDGPSISAKSIYWNGMKSKLVCTGGVTVTHGDNHMVGERMEVDLDSKELNMRKVRGTIHLPM